MRILLLGKPYFRRAFEMLGHQVLSCGVGAGHDLPVSRPPLAVEEILARLPPRWEPEFLMLGDESMFPWVGGLETLELPLVWYAVDSHIHHVWHPDYAWVFDLVCVAKRDLLEPLRAAPERQRHLWLPLFADPERDRDRGGERPMGACFVGHLKPELNPERVRFVAAVAERVPLHVHTGAYEEIYNQARIVLNQSVAGDLNFRCFEGMGCGAMLLTEAIGNGQGELFQTGRHLVEYARGDAEQAAERIRHYLKHEPERRAIAEAGRDEVREKHTALHRAAQVLSELAQAPRTAMVAARLRDRGRIAAALARVYERAAKVHLEHAMAAEGTPVGAELEQRVERYATWMLLARRAAEAA